MERKRTRLRASIIDILYVHQKACHTHHCNDVAVVSVCHSWNEFFDEQEMRDGVDVEDAADLGFCFIENGLIDSNSGIVDEASWVAVRFADLVGRIFDCGGGCDVDFVVVNIGHLCRNQR